MSPDRPLKWELQPRHRVAHNNIVDPFHDIPPVISLWDKDRVAEWGKGESTLVCAEFLESPDTPLPWIRRLLMATTPEGRLKKKVKALLKERGAWSYMPSQNGMGVVGIPDFMCCYKGLLLGIETKAPLKNPTSAEQRWKKATPNQQNRIEEIREAGGLAEVVDDVAQVEEMLRVADVRALLMQGIHHGKGGLFDGS